MAERSLATEETFLAAYTGRRSRRQHDREILTFLIADERYGVDIHELREISRLVAITPLPRVPAFLLGIITLRGTVVPILDLRRRLGFPPATPTANARILIVEHRDEPIGLLVDRVVRVERMDNAQIEAAPLPGEIVSEHVSGVARTTDDLIVLLDLAAVVNFSLEARR
jgi:purine-binding chemotaxis protein CheW